MTTYLLQVTKCDGTTYPIIVNFQCELTMDGVAFACATPKSNIDHVTIIATDERAQKLWDKYQQLKALALELKDAGFCGIKRNLFA